MGPGKSLHQEPAGICRVCGCTDLDCRGCIERTGRACYWVEADLCSACAPVDEAVRDILAGDMAALKRLEDAVAVKPAKVICDCPECRGRGEGTL